jgi:GntR family transcriptional regulator
MAGPLYRQIADQLRHLIESDALKAGMQIPTEDQLMEQYHASRNTVRGALKELTTRGLVYTLHGKGTFVSELLAPIVITLTSDPKTGRGGGAGLRRVP